MFRKLIFGILLIFPLTAFAFSTTPSGAQTLGDPYQYTFTELAPGVWAGTQKGGVRTPVMGTSVFVVGDDGVIVFDGGGAPLMSERLMTKIAEVTDKPITHVVISHWHGDHNFGVWRIVEEFPEVQVIAHPFTRAATLGRPMDYVKRSGTVIERFLPFIEQTLSTGLSADGKRPLSEKEIGVYIYIQENKDYLDSEYKRYAATLPMVTFEDKMTLYTGDKEVQLLFLGVGNTEGDIVMWLPKEKIIATGDIVVHPAPFGYNVYPAKWVATLRAVNNLDFKVLVPGHGDFQYDTSYTNLMIEAIESVTRQTDQFISDGLTQEEARAALDLSGLEDRFSKGDEYAESIFHEDFIDPLASAAYRAAKGEVLVILEREPEPEEEDNDDSEE